MLTKINLYNSCSSIGAVHVYDGYMKWAMIYVSYNKEFAIFVQCKRIEFVVYKKQS
jgi:hypothetical protein